MAAEVFIIPHSPDEELKLVTLLPGQAVRQEDHPPDDALSIYIQCPNDDDSAEIFAASMVVENSPRHRILRRMDKEDNIVARLIAGEVHVQTIADRDGSIRTLAVAHIADPPAHPELN